MKFLQRTDTEDLAASFNGDPVHLETMEGYSICASLTDTTPTTGDTFASGVLEIQTLTYPSKAAAANGDYIVCSDQAGVSYAIALTKPVAEVQTLTFPALAGATDGDYVVVQDTTGTKWAVAMDTTGLAAATPTGAAWVAVGASKKVYYDFSGAVTAAQMAAKAELAFNSLTGFSAVVTTDDSAADGTMLLTSIIKAPVVNPVPKNKDDSGVGSILGVQTIGGVAAQTPTGAAWTAATYKGLADISSDTSAANVAARAETAWNLLTGFTAAVTSDDGAANGTMTFTQTIRGPTVNPVPKTYNDSGAGSILGVQSTGGVTSAVDLTANTATLADASDYWTGLKVRLTTTTTLPTGLSAGVDYYIIAASATTVKFASSLVNAGLGTAIDLTGYGAGIATIVITDALTGTLKLQASNNAFADNTGNQEDPNAVWVDIPGSSVSVATSATQVWNVSDVYYKSVRVVWSHTVNGGTYTAVTYAKSTY